MSLNDQQRKGFIEVLAHFYYVRFIQRLVDLRHKDFLEQLDAMLQSAEREQFDDYITVLADTFGQCVQKQLSPKQMDSMFHAILTPREMHKQMPKGFRETFKQAVPHIHSELYDLCSKHKITTIKLFSEDYSLLIQAVEEGIQKSQKGYYVPVDSVQSQLDEANRLIRKLKSKLRAQKHYIDTLEEQVKEYEKLAEHLSSQSDESKTLKSRRSSQPTKTTNNTARGTKGLTVVTATEESKSVHEDKQAKRGRKPKTAVNATPVAQENSEQPVERVTSGKSKKTDVSFLNGQASLPELRMLDNLLQ